MQLYHQSRHGQIGHGIPGGGWNQRPAIQALNPALLKGKKFWLDAEDFEMLFEDNLNQESNALLPGLKDVDSTTGWTAAVGGGNIFESQNLVTNGSKFALHFNLNNNPTDGGRVYKDIGADFNLIEGEVYRLRFDCRHVGSGGICRIDLSPTNAGGGTPLRSLADADITFETIEHFFLFSSDTQFLVVRENSATNDGGVFIDNLHIEKYSPTYSSSLITNGTFDSDISGWHNHPSYLFSTFEWENGRLHAIKNSGTANSLYSDANVAVEAGKLYRIKYRSNGVGTSIINLRTATLDETRFAGAAQPAGLHAFDFYSQFTENLCVLIYVLDNGEYYFDDISVEEVTSFNDCMLDVDGNVIQWGDQSGNGNHALQIVAAKRPAYSTIFSPRVVFDGTDDVLWIDSLGLGDLYPQIAFAFWAANWDYSGSQRKILNRDDLETFIHGVSGSIVWLMESVGDGIHGYLPTFPIDDDLLKLFCFNYDGKTTNIYEQNTLRANEAATGTVALNPDQDMAIGASISETHHFDGALSGLLGFDRGLSRQAFTRLYKWGNKYQ